MTKLIIANWKSNKTLAEVQPWVTDFKKELDLQLASVESALAAQAEVQVIISPGLLMLETLSRQLEGQRFPVDVALGIQDVSPFGAGAYTGAVSVQNLAGLAVEYTLVGHSERRRYFHETHQEVAQKVDQALQVGITPVVCVDEAYIDEQAAAISRDQLERCVVAYEPLAAIGTGQNADVGTVKGIVEHVKRVFGDVPVIYGGSVTEQNVLEYLLVAQGVLAGSASLDPAHFARLVAATVRPA